MSVVLSDLEKEPNNRTEGGSVSTTVRGFRWGTSKDIKRMGDRPTQVSHSTLVPLIGRINLECPSVQSITIKERRGSQHKPRSLKIPDQTDRDDQII